MISLTSPVETHAHTWPAGLKLAGLSVATVALFYVESLLFHGVIFAVVMAVYAIPGRIFLSTGLRFLRVLWPFVAVILLWHLWTDTGSEGMRIVLRMLSAVALANLVTMTTRLSDMIAVLRVVLSPLQRFGLKPQVLALSIALVIRMTPVLLEKGRLLLQSWRARSQRKSSWRIILPFTILALDDADHIAEALRARGGFTNQKDS